MIIETFASLNWILNVYHILKQNANSLSLVWVYLLAFATTSLTRMGIDTGLHSDLFVLFADSHLASTQR